MHSLKEETLMMTNRFSTGILLFSASVFLASVTTFAQSSPGAQGSPGAVQQPTMPNQQPNAAAGTLPPDADALNPQAINDQEFVRKALEGGAAEVQLGQLAEQKSQSPDVKQFGQKMVQDHTQLGDQVMKPVAKQLGVKEPKELSKRDKQLVASLEGLSGPQFDQEYIKAMVKDHKQDLKDFKSEAQMAQDPNVKKAAQEGTTVISQHLQMIEQIAQSHSVAVEGNRK
jgi:putative membrane protein